MGGGGKEEEDEEGDVKRVHKNRLVRWRGGCSMGRLRENANKSQVPAEADMHTAPPFSQHRRVEIMWHSVAHVGDHRCFRL